MIPDTAVLASIQPILAVEKHGNADSLDIVQCLGYKAITRRDVWKVGDLCVFIQPDSVLPEGAWSAIYRAKSNRVRAIRLRNSWSFGIVESPANVGYTGPLEPGTDVTAALGITKYQPPEPQDLAASGPYGFGIPKTDEHRVESLSADDLPPWGTLVDVSVKIDGQSFSALCYNEWSDEARIMVMKTAIGGRSFLYKQDCDNNFTRNERQYGVLAKLEAFCRAHHRVPLAIRGEQYGGGIQKGSHNPHSKLPLGLALFSVWLIEERHYARKGDPFYIHTIAAELGLPTVPLLERDVPLTPELIHAYAEGTETIAGLPFEGVVIQWPGGSCKVINRSYDAKK